MIVSFLRKAATISVGLALLAPSASQAAGAPQAGATLDPSFGGSGIVQLLSEFALTSYGRATESDDVLVNGGSSIHILSSLGGTGEAFGGVGTLSFPPANGNEFQDLEFMIDPQGRLLVVGSLVFPESANPSPVLENGSPAFKPAVLRILRVLPDGRLDPSFGAGGVLETSLGLPPPRGKRNERLGSHPSIQPGGVAVDAQGRIIVTGGAVVGLGGSCIHDVNAAVAVSAGFVARFTESGKLDPSFGRKGLFGGRSLSENPLGALGIFEPLVSPGGRITYLSGGAYTCERDRSHFGVAQLTPDGRIRTAFGNKGAILGLYSALAAKPDGSVLALSEVPARRERESSRARLIRIAPNGKRDVSFGKNGRAEIDLGTAWGTRLDALAVESGGRIMLGGTLGSRKGRSTLLLRLSAQGKWEDSFGPHGRVTTRVQRLTQGGPSDLFFDSQGRLVTVHRYSGRKTTDSGLVVARYLLQN
ncbi:MAG: hypothetical protein AB7V58_07310 [Solirubrobacterales bacterium]